MAKLDINKVAWSKERESAPETANSQGLAKRMGSFNKESAVRPTKVRSVLVALSELEEFEGNPRAEYTGDEQEALEESIEKNGVTEEIGVIYIRDTAKYIVCDGHRRKRAIAKVKGPNAETEVIVRKEFDSRTPEVDLYLRKIAISTSTLKKKLSVYEQIKAIKAFIAAYDAVNKSKTPSVLSQKHIYDELGYTKTNAMQLAKLMEQFDEDEIKSFEGEEISASFIRKIAPLMDGFEKHPELRQAIVDSIRSGNLSSNSWKDAIAAIRETVKKEEQNPGIIKQITENMNEGLIEDKDDVRIAVETRMDVETSMPDDSIPDPEERDAKVTEISKQRAKKEKEQKMATDPQEMYHRDVRKSSQLLTKSLLSFQLSSLGESDRAEMVNQLMRTKHWIEQFLNNQAPEAISSSESENT